MLKKSDLAKQFELVVQQEIKNYQDSLNFVLQSINELKGSIALLRSESLESYANLHREHNSLAIEVKRLNDVNSDVSQKLDYSLEDQRKVNERNALEMRDIESAFHSKISSQNNVNDKIKDISFEISKLNSNADRNYRVLNDNLDDLIRRFRNDISKMKQEILDMPTEASLVKIHLEEKIVRHTVDVAGIMKELKIYKHDNMVTQKKIENIYTLIDRLKKSEVLL